jgi:5-methylcytosine-specific restriction protein A
VAAQVFGAALRPRRASSRLRPLAPPPARAAAGDVAWRVNIRFDTLLDPRTEPLLSREFLRSTPFSAMHWDTQMSGISIPEHIADALEDAWATHTGGTLPPLPEELPADTPLYEGGVRQITVNAYERNPAARRRCIALHGPRCAICGFDFASAYGPAGAGIIHVHHLRPLSTIGQDYVVDPITDLIPVCPNCHAVIHRRPEPHTIEEIRAFLAAQSSA